MIPSQLSKSIEREEKKIKSLCSLEDESRAEGNTSLAFVWARARARAEKELVKLRARRIT